MGVTYLIHNAIVSSRPRFLGLEGAFVENMPLSTHAQPAFVLKPDWNFKGYQSSVRSLLATTLGLQRGCSRLVCLTATLMLMSETG